MERIQQISYLTPTLNIEAESAVLGAVLLEPSVMDEVQYLERDDFSLETHRLIWRVIKHHYTNNEPIDSLMIGHTLNKHRKLADVGGVSYLHTLASSCGSSEAAKGYAEILRETSIKRKGVEIGNELIRLATEENIPKDVFTQKAQELISKLENGNVSNLKHVSAERQNFFEYITTPNSILTSGFKAFDEWAGGYTRGDLKITAARPSVGKTAKSLMEAAHMASLGEGAVHFYSQETKTKKLLMRIAANRTGVNANRMRLKTLDTSEIKKLNDDFDLLEKLPIYFYDSNVSIDEIRSNTRQFKRTHGKVALIAVDYLTLMNIPQLNGERWDQSVGRVTRNAKRIAEEADCVFNMLAQLNRDGEGGEPTLKHLKDSGDIEQDADIVEFLYHDEADDHKDGKVIRSSIAKGRDIGTNKFKYLFKGWVQRYEDLR